MIKAVMLTAGFGEGHHMVAEALAKRFSARGVRPVVLDCYRSNHPKMAGFGEWIYEWTTRYTPGLYGASYDLTAGLGPDHRFWRVLSSVSKKQLLGRLRSVDADIILQLFPDHVLAGKTQRRTGQVIGSVLTDFSVHGRWFHQNIDIYFIPDERLLHAVRPFVSEHADCIPTGIPVRDQFLAFHPTGDAQATPYILVATGGRGVFPELSAAIQVLGKTWPKHHIYVMCGRNDRMKQQVDLLGNQVHGVPYVAEMAPWLQHADFAMVKSGGLTVAECFAAGTPMLIYRPQPGQEAGNARFAASIGSARIARNMRALEAEIKRMAEVDVLQTMRSACLSVAHADAADRIVDACLSRLEHDRA